MTNTPPLGAPNGVFGSAAFGTITTAGDPRVIQLAVKLLFSVSGFEFADRAHFDAAFTRRRDLGSQLDRFLHVGRLEQSRTQPAAPSFPQTVRR